MKSVGCVSLSAWTGIVRGRRLRVWSEGLLKHGAGGQKVSFSSYPQHHVNICKSLWTLLYHCSESTCASLSSSSSQLCRHQRDVSFSLVLFSAQPYVAAGSETVCRRFWSGCFTELWAAPLAMAQAQAGQWKLFQLKIMQNLQCLGLVIFGFFHFKGKYEYNLFSPMHYTDSMQASAVTCIIQSAVPSDYW